MFRLRAVFNYLDAGLNSQGLKIIVINGMLK